MQKTYCADFLTKKMVKNVGQVQQYYVEDSHPAIISALMSLTRCRLNTNAGKLLENLDAALDPSPGRSSAGNAVGLYGRKVWGSYQNDKSRRRVIYRCDDKYKGEGNAQHRT